MQHCKYTQNHARAPCTRVLSSRIQQQQAHVPDGDEAITESHIVEEDPADILHANSMRSSSGSSPHPANFTQLDRQLRACCARDGNTPWKPKGATVMDKQVHRQPATV